MCVGETCYMYPPIEKGCTLPSRLSSNFTLDFITERSSLPSGSAHTKDYIKPTLTILVSYPCSCFAADT